jgi:hypothetical protein
MKYKMKTIQVGFMCILIIFNSCKNTLDRKNFNSINETVLNASIENDTLAIKNLYVTNDEKNGFSKYIPNKIKPLVGKEIDILKTDTITQELLQHKIKSINTFFKSDTNYYSLESYYPPLARVCNACRSSSICNPFMHSLALGHVREVQVL